jgi:hypothetical protein
MGNDPAFTEALADDADEILREILQHHHIRRGAAFERNQHDCSLFILLDLRAGGRGTTVCAGFVGTPASGGGHGPWWASH